MERSASGRTDLVSSGTHTTTTNNNSAAAQRSAQLALLSVLLLIVQGTALSIALRYSRVKKGTPYLASVSVLITEVAKLVICLSVQLWNCRAAALEEKLPVAREFKKQLREIVAQAVPMLLPAGMFVMQQVLLIVAATHLDAVAFQIFSQSFKLVPTALFAYWLLGQHLEPIQWASIPVLAAGVILVTINNGGAAGGVAERLAVKRAAAAAARSGSWVHMGWMIGMITCSISGLSSAYAGVYFEKYVKGKHAASLWVRNIQLGIFGVPLSTAYMIIKDGSRIYDSGPLQGFDYSAWLVVGLQVFGGLVTGMVVKYCDNILKNFALAISVILTVLVVIPLFGQWPSGFFLLGVALVLLSVFMYGKVVSLDTPRSLLHWFKKAVHKCFPWLGGNSGQNRHLWYILAATCLTVVGVAGICGMQRYFMRALLAAQQRQQATAVAVTKQMMKDKLGGMRGAASLLQNRGGQVKQ